jgi:hypothetical protein
MVEKSNWRGLLVMEAGLRVYVLQEYFRHQYPIARPFPFHMIHGVQ